MGNESESNGVEIVINTDADNSGISASEIIIGAMYIVGIGINIYIIVDQTTDGALSRELSMFFYHLKGKVKAYWREQREYRKGKGAVVWEAMETVNRKGETE